jgi:cation transport ATPase
MRKILLQSAVGGMALSLIGMGFASFGLITPVMGAIFQQAIDAVAIGNSLRLTFSNNIKTDI